jgi:RNA-directed DNA polymerase
MALIERIASELNFAPKYVSLMAITASHRYKIYGIPKKNGGTRTIEHPARELKLFQRWLANNLFTRLPVHRAASAYKVGSSILRNATQHRSHNFILKIDFKDFFPSIRASDIYTVLEGHLDALKTWIASPSDIELACRLVCRNGHLTIGAPSSPIISNCVMYEFDQAWATASRRNRTTYTRYADDLYFSTNERNVLEGMLSDLRVDLKLRNHPILQINEDKTVFTSRKRRRLVTGLVLTPTGTISLGRHRKRTIKSLVFRKLQGRLQPDQLVSLKGMLSYAQSVEPSFVERLRRKYGPLD